MAAGVEQISEFDGPTTDRARLEILDAAANCFMERGYSTTSIDDVARRLGSTKGRIYHHYPSKADLFADVFKTGMDMNYQVVVPVFDKPGNHTQRLINIARAHTRNMIVTKPFQCAVWEGVEMHLRGSTTPEQRGALSKLTEYRSQYGKMFKTILADGRKAGEFDFENLGIAYQLMITTLNSPVFWYSPRADESGNDINKLTDEVVAFAMRGLGYKGELDR